MKCPYCNYEESKVVDSRPTDEYSKIRRRRECVSCGGRFTTYEVVEIIPIIVVKKDKTREQYDRSKFIGGILKASEGCKITLSQIESIANNFEKSFAESYDKEISSRKIGDFIMDKLKEIDSIAYVRYASVYKEFKDITSFMIEIKKLLKENNK